MSFYVIESVDNEIIKFKWAIPQVTPEQFSLWQSYSGGNKGTIWRNTGGILTCDGFTISDATFYVNFYFYKAYSRCECAQGFNELLLTSGVQNTYNLKSITNKGWDNLYPIPLTNNFSFYVRSRGVTSFTTSLGINFPSSGGWYTDNTGGAFWCLVYANNTLYIACFTDGYSTGTHLYDMGATGSVSLFPIGTEQDMLALFLNSGEQNYRFTTRIAFDDQYIIAPSTFTPMVSQQLTIDMIDILYDGSPFCEIPIENLQVQLPSMFQPSKSKRLGTFIALNTAYPSTLFDFSNHSCFPENIFDNIEFIAPQATEFTSTVISNTACNCNFSFYRNANDVSLTAYKHEWINNGTLGLHMNIISDQVVGTLMQDKYWSGPFLYPSNYAFSYPTDLGEYIPSNWSSLNLNGRYRGFLFFRDLLTENIILAYAQLIPSENQSTNGRIHLEFETVSQLIPNGSLSNGNIKLVTSAEPEPYDKPDPYNPGGTSGEGGGDGSYTRPNDDINVPIMPPLSPVSTKFISVFSPTLAQLNDFASFLWSNAFSIETLKKIFTNPIDLVLGASIVPVAPDTDVLANLVFGGISSGVSMNHVSNIYKEIDCGTLSVTPFWDNFIDYAPYTKLSIFLPFIPGSHELLIDDFMKHTITVKYRINILSGACVAYIIQDNATHPKVLYQFSGNCATNIPVTDVDYTQNIFSSIMTGAMFAGSIAALGAGTAAGTVAGAALAGEGARGLASSVKNVGVLKPSYNRASGITGEAGLLAVRKPYLIYEAFHQSLPQSLNKFNGLPINATYTLSELKGFTQVKYIRLNSVPATSEELDEIVNILKEGVIL